MISRHDVLPVWSKILTQFWKTVGERKDPRHHRLLSLCWVTMSKEITNLCFLRRSRRELLLELQSDEDSLLREYARVSLQASGVLDTQRHVEQDNCTTSHAEIQAPQHDNVAEDNEPPSRERKRLEVSAYLTPLPPPPSQSAIYTTPQTAQTSSTLVDTPPSLYITPLSSLQTPPSLRQSGTPSKSEALMARGKGLREKGKEIQSRLAEIRERQKVADKRRKGGKGDAGVDIWGTIADREE